MIAVIAINQGGNQYYGLSDLVFVIAPNPADSALGSGGFRHLLGVRHIIRVESRLLSIDWLPHSGPPSLHQLVWSVVAAKQMSHERLHTQQEARSRNMQAPAPVLRIFQENG
jgi:hypothetical protein